MYVANGKDVFGEWLDGLKDIAGRAAYLAVDAAISEVKEGRAREVPLHLRDATLDAGTRGHGIGYKYPHDFPGHHVRQDYMPGPLRFYEPSDQGDEKRIKEFLKPLRGGS